jgi:hypothetical protein
MTAEFDPVSYGVFMEKVKANEQKINVLNSEIEEMAKDIKTLLLLAERSKGSLFALMGASSVIGGVLGLLIDWAKK